MERFKGQLDTGTTPVISEAMKKRMEKFGTTATAPNNSVLQKRLERFGPIEAEVEPEVRKFRKHQI